MDPDGMAGMKTPWVSTVNGYRRIQDARRVVHIVNMKHRTAGQRLVDLKTGNIVTDRGETLCGQRSWKLNGAWLAPDAVVTCLVCLGAMP